MEEDHQKRTACSNEGLTHTLPSPGIWHAVDWAPMLPPTTSHAAESSHQDDDAIPSCQMMHRLRRLCRQISVQGNTEAAVPPGASSTLSSSSWLGGAEAESGAEASAPPSADAYVGPWLAALWWDSFARTGAILTGDDDNPEDIGAVDPQSRWWRGGAGRAAPPRCGAQQPSKFANYASLFTGNNRLHVFFPLNVRWDALTVAVNANPGFRQHGKKIDPRSLPWMILCEVFRCRAFGVPLGVSLQPTRPGSALSPLCSTMHAMLRTTVTGHVLGLLAVWALGYVSGGTYTARALLSYDESAPVESLQKDLLDPLKELLTVRKARQAKGQPVDGLPTRYICLSDLTEEEGLKEGVDGASRGNPYSVAFQLRGALLSVQQSKGTVLEPESRVLAETTVRIKPELACELAKGMEGGAADPASHTAFSKAIVSMRRELEESMASHPTFAPYFDLLRVISFCAAVADAMFDAGAFPQAQASSSASASVGSTQVGAAAMSGVDAALPMVFPPLPVRRGPVVQIEISFDDVADTICKSGKQGPVNRMVRDDVGRTSMEERTQCLMAAARAAALRAVKAQAPHAEGAIDLLDDGTLQVAKIASSFRHFLQKIVCLAIAAKVIGMMKGMCNICANAAATVMDTQEIDDRYVETYEGFQKLISYAKTVFMKKWWSAVEAEVNRQREGAIKSVEEQIQTRAQVEAQTRAEVEEKIDAQIQHSLSLLRDRLQREADASFRNRGYQVNDTRQKNIQATIKREVQKAKTSMEQDAQRKKERIVRDNVNKRMDGMRAAVGEAKKEIEKNARGTLNKIREASKDLQAEINSAQMMMDRDPLGSYLGLNTGFKCTLLKTRFKLGYADTPTGDDPVWEVRGFVGLKGQQCLMEKNSALSQRHLKYCSGAAPPVWGGERLSVAKAYYQLDVPFIHFAGGPEAAQRLVVAASSSPRDAVLLPRCRWARRGGAAPQPAGDWAQLDAFGMHAGHYVGCLPIFREEVLKAVPKELLRRPGLGGLTPLHCATLSGNVKAVEALIAAGADPRAALPDGTTALLAATAHNYGDVALLLLRRCGGGASSVDSAGMTPLHWAAVHNNAAVARQLFSAGASASAARCLDGATPVHLAARAGAAACLEVLLDGYPQHAWLRSADRRAPLHDACWHNNPGCAAVLLAALDPDERVRAVEMEDKALHTPLTLAMLQGYEKLALLLCESARLNNTAVITCHLSSERRRLLERDIAQLPQLAAHFNVGKLPEGGPQHTGAAVTLMATAEWTRERIVTSCMQAEKRDALIQECIHLRDAACLKRLALHGSLTPVDVRTILLAVATYGLLDWPVTLTNCGIDVCTANVDGKGHDLLLLSAMMDDRDLLKAVWSEYARFTPRDRHYSHLVRALVAVPMSSGRMWEVLAELFHGVEGAPAVGEADPLLEGAVTTVSKWTFARHFRLQPSQEAVIRAAGQCRPTVLQCLLSEGVGMDEDVQLLMLQCALQHNRKDNALTVLLNTWPTFTVTVAVPANAALASSVQKLVDQENMAQFKKEIDVQEEVMQSPLRLQEVIASAGKRFFEQLTARQFYPMENRLFGVYAWLLTSSTEKYRCPWDAEIEDERGMNGFICCCGSVCGTPTSVLAIAESIGTSVEELLLHPSFTTSIRMCNGPVTVVQKILETYSSRLAMAACLASIAQVEIRSVKMWQTLLEAVPAVRQELPYLLECVVNPNDQVTLLMQLLPLPEAGELLHYAFETEEVGGAMKMRDRYGRSAAHHLLAYELSERQSQCPGIREAIAAVQTKRLKQAMTLYPGLLHLQDREGYTLFMLAARHNNTSSLTYLASLAPAAILDRSITMNDGWSALHAAAAFNAVNAVRTLVTELGLSPNARSNLAAGATKSLPRSLTPLHIAAHKSNAVMFRLLVHLGADPLIPDSRGDTPLHWAVRYGDDALFRTIRLLPGFWMLHLKGELLVPLAANERLSGFYAAHLVNVTHPNRARRSRRQRTALLEAAREGTVQTIHELASKGADVLSFDAERWNALHLTAIRGQTAMMAQILRYAALSYSPGETEKLLTQCTANGDSPLHFAAQCGSLGAIQLLLAFPCVRKNLQKQNNKGLIPANVAVLSGHGDVAEMLLEAGSAGGPSSPVIQPSHEETLRRFWVSVAAESKKRAKEKMASLKMVQLPQRDVQQTLAQTTEEAWESAKNSWMCPCASLLPVKELEVLLKHPAFGADPVKWVVADALLESLATSKAPEQGSTGVPSENTQRQDAQHVRALLQWCIEYKHLPSHAVIFCVQRIILWEPILLWERVTRLFTATLGWWSVEAGEYPGEHHVVWDWLAMFFSGKGVGDFLESDVYDLLETFLSYTKGPLANSLPPLTVAVGMFEEHAFSSVVRRNLGLITAQLSKAKSPEELHLMLSHLNALWDRICRHAARPSALAVKGQHWMILENFLFHRFGGRVLRTMEFLKSCDEPIPQDVLSFVLEGMVSAPPDTSDTALMSWATAVTATSSAVGLALVRRVFEKLEGATAVDEQKTLSSHFGLLPFFTNIIQSITELESEELILDCVRVTPSHSGTVQEYIETVSAAIKKKILDFRTERLGKDRPTEELLAAFLSSPSSSSGSYKPHLFSFDGTPTVSLPQKELHLLGQVINMVEAESSRISVLSVSQIKEEAINAGTLISIQANAQKLAVLISLVREGIYRTMQKRPFRIQCMCLAAFVLPLCLSTQGGEEVRRFKGRLAQVATGEGKSIVVSMLAATLALMGKTVDVITSSGTLASRDAAAFADFYRLFGLRSSHISVDTPTRHHFNAEVVYGTNTDFEFVLLREGCFMESICMYDPHGANSWVTRPREVAIVDEADNLFLDAAQNSARIAYAAGECFTWVYAPIYELVAASKVPPSVRAVREKLAALQGGYYAHLAELLLDSQLEGWVKAAQIAEYHHHRDKEYIVRQQQVVIVDLDTGRLQESSRWGHGIHEMIEVKEGVPVEPESGVIGSIAHPSFFDNYNTVLGITGTAGEPEERDEIGCLYGIDTFDVPPHRPCLRQRYPTIVCRTTEEKRKEIVRAALQKRLSTAVLVLVPTIAESNDMAERIRSTQKGVPCFLLNETQRENEEFVLLKASQPGTILVATNTAGRGTDIQPSNRVLENGGLHVIYGAFPPNLRVECQGLGRSARQGQPGSSQIFIALDEDFVCRTLGFTFALRPDNMEMCVEKLYAARTAYVQKESVRRSRITALERVYFACFQHFTRDQQWLRHDVLTMRNEEAIGMIRGLLKSESCSLRISVEEVMQRLCECFRILWVYFFTTTTGKPKSSPSVDMNKVYTDRSVVQRGPIAEAGSDLYRSFLTTSKWSLTCHPRVPSSGEATENLAKVFMAHIELLERLEKTQTEAAKKKEISQPVVIKAERSVQNPLLPPPK